MVFNVEIIVKNKEGVIVIQEPVKNATDLFKKNFSGKQVILKVVSELQDKIKTILKLRGIFQESNFKS